VLPACLIVLSHCSRFQPVTVPEPTIDETYEILQGLRERYETHHKLRYTGAAPHSTAAATSLRQFSAVRLSCLILHAFGPEELLVAHPLLHVVVILAAIRCGVMICTSGSQQPVHHGTDQPLPVTAALL
jgi:hypothetical protein